MENDELTKVIIHYQQGIEKYSQRNDEAKILHCISKLHRLPIKVQNLEHTGVGRTVNSLRKINGKIGDSAKLLVGKWKEMVMEEGDEQNNSKVEHESHEEPKKHSSGSDYKASDKRSKFVEPNSYTGSSEKNVYENEKKIKNTYDKNATSSKRKSSNDSDEDIDQRIGKYHHRHKFSKQTHGDNLDEDDYSQIQNNKNESKHGSSKGKKDDVSKKNQKTMELKKSSDDNLDQQLSLKKKKIEIKEDRHSSRHKKEKKDYKSRKYESSHKSNRGSIENTKSVTDTKEKHSKRHESKKSKSESLNDNFSNIGESIGENGIGSGSGTSFADALGMLIPGSSKSKKKVSVQLLQTKKDNQDNSFIEQELGLLAESKLEPLNINVSHLLPDITPNYRPLGNLINGQSRNKILNDDETLVQIMNTKISRTKVFSGNKCIFGKVPSLFDMCTRILQDNIDSLEYTGGVPFDILKPVIERATSEQLFTLEHHNPYLIEDTDELWKFHCQKEFRNKNREEMETWRDMYLRCLDEREAKLKALTANIKLSQDKSLPVRQTKLAYVDGIVKPDRNILRKQAKFGTGIKDSKPLVTPSARLAKIVSNSTSGQVVVPNISQRITSTSSSNLKPKKAPLMQKTLSFMKNRHFRR